MTLLRKAVAPWFSAGHHRDAFWNLSGSILYSACQWLVLVATVKIASPEDVGRLSLGFAITAPVFLLLQLRLRAASATDASTTYARSTYVSLRALCTLLALITILLFCKAIHLPGDQFGIVMLVALAKAIESGSDLTYGFSQQTHNLRAVAISMSARGVLSLLIFCFVLLQTHRLFLALVGLCVAWAIVFVSLDLPPALGTRAIATTSSGTTQDILRLAWLTLPLGLSTMLMSVTANMPRYLIQHALGVGALGIFSAAGYLTMTGSVIISAIAEASIARVAQHLMRHEILEAAAILRRVRDLTLGLSILLIGVSVFAGKQILAHLYKPEYAASSGLLSIMMCAAGVANLASVYGYALIAARRFQAYLLSLALSAAVTAIACIFAIPLWSTMGAAVGCLVGYLTQSTSAYLLLRSTLRMPATASQSVGALSPSVAE